MPDLRMQSVGGGDGKRLFVLTQADKRRTSAVFARIAQQDAADGHHAEEEIVVKMRNDLQGTECRET